MEKIEKNVPVPGSESACACCCHAKVTSRRGGRGRVTSWPFAKMAVGDSILTKRSMDAANSALQRYRGKCPRKVFKVKAVFGGVRVWRIK